MAGGFAGYGFYMADKERAKKTNRYIDAGFTLEQAQVLALGNKD